MCSLQRKAVTLDIQKVVRHNLRPLELQSLSFPCTAVADIFHRTVRRSHWLQIAARHCCAGRVLDQSINSSQKSNHQRTSARALSEVFSRYLTWLNQNLISFGIYISRIEKLSDNPHPPMWHKHWSVSQYFALCAVMWRAFMLCSTCVTHGYSRHESASGAECEISLVKSCHLLFDSVVTVHEKNHFGLLPF